jgi:hypothetical protein
MPIAIPRKRRFFLRRIHLFTWEDFFQNWGDIFYADVETFLPKTYGGRSKLSVHFRLHFFAAKNLYIWMLGFSLAD